MHFMFKQTQNTQQYKKHTEAAAKTEPARSLAQPLAQAEEPRSSESISRSGELPSPRRGLKKETEALSLSLRRDLLA